MKPNEKRTIELSVLAEQMTVTADLTYDTIIEPGKYTLFVGGILDTTNMLQQQFTIDGTVTPLSNC